MAVNLLILPRLLRPILMYSVDVYFTYADRRYWWTRFLKTGFSHVFIKIPLIDGSIIIDPNFNNLQITYLENGQKISKNLQKPAILVKYYTNVNLNGYQFRPLNCVEIVKKIIGVNKPLIFTPYQLYRYLLWDLHQSNQSKQRHKRHLR
jgi:hypothetical protein